MLLSTARVLVLLFMLLPITVTASEFYVGFMFGMISRSGIVIGYKLDDENSVETHFGGLPHNVTYGVSLKHSNRSKEYVLLGYSAVSQWSVTDGIRVNQGLQLGIGRRIDTSSGDWSQSVEVIGGQGYDFKNKQWGPLISFGFGSTYKEFD